MLRVGINSLIEHITSEKKRALDGSQEIQLFDT